MAQERHEHPDTLEQLESLGDQLARWTAEHAVLVLAVAGAILAVAAGIGGYQAWSRSITSSASAELAEVRSGYVEAMGGKAGDVDVPEPANPETARGIRSEYLQKFLDLARSRSGTVVGAMAALEASRLHEALGAPDPALEVLDGAIAPLDASDPTRGVLLVRRAVLLEADGRFEEAAQAYETAGGIEGYPLRADALAQAARSWAEAGKKDAALAAWERLRALAPEYRAAPWVESRMKELGAS